MSITARDRKILAVLAVLAVVAVYWLMLLGPKREEATEAAQELTEQEERRDTAEAMLAELQTARQSFETDYATVVRLGKALPTEVDVPSLMVQLEDAAHGAGIAFDSITVGERTAVATATAPTPGWDRARARSSRRVRPGDTCRAGLEQHDRTVNGPDGRHRRCCPVPRGRSARLQLPRRLLRTRRPVPRAQAIRECPR